ncbi:VOC family protein [Alteromonas aestuariivivens]|uniref:VOC family protein n=1 Tax=Alteromonas aestuariivivens TaxID=1938339 RepID=A0A3D8M518_9ALTE|nr:VOC family protein [Alteromonas aestuariivivens]RDV24635.1 VOC family protein [Alteromonas aestuariivivens]
MASNPVGWFEIYVEDMQRARSFYESVFNVTFESLMDPTDDGLEMWTFPSDMESYGATGALVRMPGYPAGGNSIIVYFSCEDCAVEESRVPQSGGSVVRAKMAIGEYGFISLVKDSEGNTLGLHSMK